MGTHVGIFLSNSYYVVGVPCLGSPILELRCLGLGLGSDPWSDHRETSADACLGKPTVRSTGAGSGWPLRDVIEVGTTRTDVCMVALLPPLPPCSPFLSHVVCWGLY